MTANALSKRKGRGFGLFLQALLLFAKEISRNALGGLPVPGCLSDYADSPPGRLTARPVHVWGVWNMVYGMTALVLAAGSAFGHGAQTALRTLNTATEILELNRSEASRQFPVRLRGVITAFHLADPICFVQDDTAGVYLYWVNSILEPGQLVEVTGVTGAGRFAPIVEASQVRVIGRAELPDPHQISIDQLASGSEDSQWVALTGIVHSQASQSGRLHLDLAQGSDLLKVQVLNIAEVAIPDFIDCKVRVFGVAGTHYNSRGQLSGFHLLTPSLAQVRIVEPAQPDPFALPALPVSEVLSYSRRSVAGHRVRVRGQVTLYRPGERLCLQDASGGLKVRTTEKAPLQLGTTVDVVGFPTRSDAGPVLRSSVIRVVAPGVEVQPRNVSIREAAHGEHENQLVQISAVLTHLEPSFSSGVVFFLEADRRAFRALLPRSQVRPSAPLPEVGSQIEVRGLCSVALGEAQIPGDPQLELRSADDLRVVRGPQWWKRERVRVLGNVIAGLAAVSFLGIGILHRQARGRTRAVRERETKLEEQHRELFESANDIIYKHDLDGKLLMLNRAGQQALGYSEEDVGGLSFAHLMDPNRFGSLMRDLSDQSARGVRGAYDIELMGKQGQRIYLEVNARLLYESGRPVGVQGIARDVTERKAAELALGEREEQLRRSLQEREQLGRDLHDSIIQSIYAVGLALDGCRRSLAEAQEPTQRCLDKCVADLNAVIRDVRRFILGLEPQALSGHELKGALKSLILTMDQSQPGRFELHLEKGVSGQLGVRQATQLLHVAREAMTNSLRHSQAQKIVVSLSKQGDGVCFEVRDDGVGFDPDLSRSRGQGLRNIAARARELNAECQILSQPGGGTRVLLIFSHDAIYSNSPRASS